MNEILMFLAAPIAMCFLLAGIHCYLGLHVLARGVIFVDLSLAQIAALGMMLATLAGFDANSVWSYLAALLSTFVAAGVFALAKQKNQRFSEEAVIGTVYAFGAAAAVLAIDKMAHGSEQIKQLLIGNILWVTWSQVLSTSIIYALVATLHYIFRVKFISASFSRIPNSQHGITDFAFYALFGTVITSSVRMSGVLQVFAYLIVPALLSGIFYTTIRSRLICGWLLGGTLSAAAMIGSYFLDVPSGAFVVVCFTILPIGFILLPQRLLFRKLTASEHTAAVLSHK